MNLLTKISLATLVLTSTALAQFTPTPVPFGHISRNAPHASSQNSANFHTVANTDTTATLILPNEWKITGGTNQAIEAVGPGGAAVHLGFVIPNIFDTINQSSRYNAMLAARNHTPGILCPYEESLATAYKCVLQQKRKNVGQKPNNIRVLTSHPADLAPNETKAILLEANTQVDDGSGPMQSTIRVGMTAMAENGQWTMTVSGVQAPATEFLESNRPVLAAIVASYRRNGHAATFEMQPILDSLGVRTSAPLAMPSAHDASPPQ